MSTSIITATLQDGHRQMAEGPFPRLSYILRSAFRNYPLFTECEDVYNFKCDDRSRVSIRRAASPTVSSATGLIVSKKDLGRKFKLCSIPKTLNNLDDGILQYKQSQNSHHILFIA